MLRKKRKLSQQELASALSVDRSTVAKWENGGFPRADKLPKLAKILKCKVDDFFVANGGAFSRNRDIKINAPRD